ncbi:MAG: restriction endonuclease [Thermoflexales bacterium]|nr:restriction endonuclease [Thermoflexales bacterium]
MSFTPGLEVNLAALCVGAPILALFVFVGAALYAFVREQAQNQPASDHQSVLAAYDVDRLSQSAFRQLVGEALHRRGYTVVLPQSDAGEGDWGMDLVLSKEGRRYFALVVHYPRTVSLATVELAEARRKQFGCDSAMVITNGSFQPQAQRRAAALGHRLIDRSALAELLT